MFFFFFKQKTAYEMRISDWSSDVCSSDLKSGQIFERGFRVGQQRFVHRPYPAFEQFAALDIVLDVVDAVEGDRPALLEIGDGEFARSGIAAQHRLVITERKASGLELQVILVRPEPWQRVIGLEIAHDRTRGDSGDRKSTRLNSSH